MRGGIYLVKFVILGDGNRFVLRYWAFSCRGMGYRSIRNYFFSFRLDDVIGIHSMGKYICDEQWIHKFYL